jgi:hypothetical protein
MKKVVVLLIAMLGLAGCPNNKSNSNPYGTVGLVGNCVNCGFNQAVFSQSVTSEIPQAALTLQLAGDANQMNLWARNAQNPLFSYQGPLSISGTMTVVSMLPFGMCQLPAGQYTVRTIQAGIYNMGVFQVSALELQGPVRMIVAISEGTILTNGNGVISGFGGLMVGVQGPSMNSWGYQGNMGMNACSDTIGVRF